MKAKTRRSFAYILVVIFFLVGVICYAAFPEDVPDEPVRIMFQSTAGSVLFDHQGHLSDSGYGLECESCHHEDYDDPQSCGECHNEDEDVSRVDAFHGQCKGCHEEDSGPVECSECHVL